MNMIKFTQLVANITRQHAISFTDDELKWMLDTIKDGTEPTQQPIFQPPSNQQIQAASGQEVMDMMNAMATGKKIEAIKACRSLTGLGLKEAKDMIETAMNPRGVIINNQ